MRWVSVVVVGLLLVGSSWAEAPAVGADAPPEIRAIFEKMHSGKPPSLEEQQKLRTYLGGRTRASDLKATPATPGTLGALPADVQEILAKQRRGEALTGAELGRLREFGNGVDGNQRAILQDLEAKKAELEAAKPDHDTRREKAKGPLRGEVVLRVSQTTTTSGDGGSSKINVTGAFTVPVEFRVFANARPLEFTRTAPVDEPFTLEALAKPSAIVQGSTSQHVFERTPSSTTDATTTFTAQQATMFTAKVVFDKKKPRPVLVVNSAVTGQSVLSGSQTTGAETKALNETTEQAGQPWQPLTVDALDPSQAVATAGGFGYNVANFVPPELKAALASATVAFDAQALAKGLSSGKRFEVASSTSWSMTTSRDGSTSTTTTRADVTWRFQNESPEVDFFVELADYDTWLPKADLDNAKSPGNVLHVTARLGAKDSGYLPAPVQLRKVTFELKGTSRVAGRCLNVPPRDPDPDGADFKFAPNSGNKTEKLVGDERQTLIVTPEKDTALAELESYDFGGWSTLTVTAELADGTILKGHRPLHVETELPIPDRDPGRHVARAFLKDHPADTDDVDDEKPKWATNSHPGDGLSAYEEYRGVRGKDGHVRLDPVKQDLIVESRYQPGNDKLHPGYQLFTAVTDVQVIELDEAQLAPDRVVNTNGTEHRLGPQKGLRVVSGKVDGDTCGEEPALAEGKLPKSPNDALQLTISYEPKVFNHPGFNRCVAHELGHGVGMLHHGLKEGSMKYIVDGVAEGSTRLEWRNPDKSLAFITCVNSRCPGKVTDGKVHWFDAKNNEVPAKFTLKELADYPAGVPGGPGSGDLDCLMSYSDYYGARMKNEGALATLYMVPDFNATVKVCTAVKATHYNLKWPDVFFGESAPSLAPCSNHLRVKSY